ncbi:hypothetical protein ABZ917_00640 [Nonomuraea wenchangensis]
MEQRLGGRWAGRPDPGRTDHGADGRPHVGFAKGSYAQTRRRF